MYVCIHTHALPPHKPTHALPQHTPAQAYTRTHARKHARTRTRTHAHMHAHTHNDAPPTEGLERLQSACRV